MKMTLMGYVYWALQYFSQVTDWQEETHAQHMYYKVRLSSLFN